MVSRSTFSWDHTGVTTNEIATRKQARRTSLFMRELLKKGSNRGLYSAGNVRQCGQIVKLFQKAEGRSFLFCRSACWRRRTLFTDLLLARRCGLRVSLVILWCVLHDQGHALVRRIERVIRFPQALIGKPAYLRNLVRSDPAGLHQTASRVGAIAGQFPVAEVRRAGVRLGIGVAFNREGV